MNWFNRLKISKKLQLGFLVVSCVALIIGYIGIRNIRAVDDMGSDIYKGNMLPDITISKSSDAFLRIRVLIMEYITTAKPEKRPNLLKRLNARRADIVYFDSDFEKTIKDDSVKYYFDSYKEIKKKYFVEIDNIIKLVDAGNIQAAFAIYEGSLDKIRESYQKSITKTFDYGLKLAAEKAEIKNQKTDNTILAMIILIIVGFGAAIGLGMYIAKQIGKPIKNIVEIANRVAIGDINVNIEQTTFDEIGELEKVFALLVEKTKEESYIADKIAQGNLSTEIKPKSVNDALAYSINKIISTVKNLRSEIKELTRAAQDGDLKARGNTKKFAGEYKEIVTGINDTLDSLINPLYVAADYFDKISAGEIPEKITQELNGEFNSIKNNLNKCIESIHNLIEDANLLSVAAMEGNLSARADITKHNGDYKKIISGFNGALDSVVAPLNMAAEYVEKISKGSMPPKITEDFKGDFEAVKNNLNTCIDAINNLIADANVLATAAIEGSLSVRADAFKHKGDFRKIIQGVNNTLDSVVDPLKIAAEYINLIGAGEVPGKIHDDYKGDFNELKNSINSCIDGLEGLSALSGILEKAAKNDYEQKASISYNGIFAKTADSVNKVLLQFEQIQKVANDIAIGKLDELDNLKLIGKRSENDKMLPAMISMMTAIRSLAEEADMLNKAAMEGKLSVRADISRQNGEFKKIVEGMNKTFDAVVAPLNIAAKYIDKISKGDLSTQITETFNGDFNSLKGNLNICISAINSLIAEVDGIAMSAVEGSLSFRADISQYHGDYKKIIEGFNKTLDAMNNPILEGVEALKVLADGDFTVSIESQYKGDHAKIKESINAMSNSISLALSDVSDAISATASAGTEISSSAEQMAAGAHEQTGQATEVAGAVEQMTKTILENTKNASHAADAAKTAGDKARGGGVIVKDTIEGMNRIADVVKKSAATVHKLGKSSDQIGEIIQVIDDIADQTNLLALNAAIEAARAGEQGRGFAVVADEVRKLAERTTKATKEIAGMIKQIQKDTSEAVISMDAGAQEVELGKAKADKAGIALQEIIDETGKVVDVVNLVAAANEEQSTAAEEISKNIDAISNVTQESASATQQIAHATEDLSRLTVNLETLIKKFKIARNRKADFDKNLLS